MSIEQRLSELGITLPPAAAPLANYVPFTREGNTLYIAGQVPRDGDGELKYVGQVGGELSLEDGQAAARLCALNCLAQVQATAGSLDAVRQVLKVGGFVNCAAGFTQHPQVVNGASDLIVDIMGDAGRHARFAVGCSSLPAGVAVEVEMTVALK